MRASRASPIEIALADDKCKTGNPDGERINTSETYQLRDWAKKPGVDEDMIRTAVVQVGNMASDVERYLNHKAKPQACSAGVKAPRRFGSATSAAM